MARPTFSQSLAEEFGESTVVEHGASSRVRSFISMFGAIAKRGIIPAVLVFCSVATSAMADEFRCHDSKASKPDAVLVVDEGSNAIIRLSGGKIESWMGPSAHANFAYKAGMSEIKMYSKFAGSKPCIYIEDNNGNFHVVGMRVKGRGERLVDTVTLSAAPRPR